MTVSSVMGYWCISQGVQYPQSGTARMDTSVSQGVCLQRPKISDKTYKSGFCPQVLWVTADWWSFIILWGLCKVYRISADRKIWIFQCCMCRHPACHSLLSQSFLFINMEIPKPYVLWASSSTQLSHLPEVPVFAIFSLLANLFVNYESEPSLLRECSCRPLTPDPSFALAAVISA